MANHAELQTPSDSVKSDQDRAHARDAWFTATPDPWEEIARLEADGDRTFASTVSRMVMSAEATMQPAMEAKLIAALGRPDLTAAGRTFACRMLGLIGTAACVPAVAGWLRRSDTVDAARSALDGIADPAADAALRDALPQVSGVAKCAIIGSIGMRGDQAAVGALTEIAMDRNESAEVRATAELAVERLTMKGVRA